MELSICHVYPDVLNLYGDRGNILCMTRRLAWRGIEAHVSELPIGEKMDLTRYDLFFIGGGQDFDQQVLLRDLKAGKGKELKAAVEDGRTFLCICGGFQMMGNYYETQSGKRYEFLGAADFYTVGGAARMTGNYAYHLSAESGAGLVVGFENHSGRTWLGSGARPLGTILTGHGNNGEDRTEGVRTRNLFGTYSHGPVLPRNPHLCDFILETALTRRYGRDIRLEPLDDRFESLAHDRMAARLIDKNYWKSVKIVV